ncbi:unnamed protein product, partial [marine sediment metagenome]
EVDVDEYECEECGKVWKMEDNAIKCERRDKCKHGDVCYFFYDNSELGGEYFAQIYPTTIIIDKRCRLCGSYLGKAQMRISEIEESVLSKLTFCSCNQDK